MKPLFHHTEFSKQPIREGMICYSSDLCVIVNAGTMVPVLYVKNGDKGVGMFANIDTILEMNSPVVVYDRETALSLIAEVQKAHSGNNISPELRTHYGLVNVYSQHLPDQKEDKNTAAQSPADNATPMFSSGIKRTQAFLLLLKVLNGQFSRDDVFAIADKLTAPGAFLEFLNDADYHLNKETCNLGPKRDY